MSILTLSSSGTVKGARSARNDLIKSHTFLGEVQRGKRKNEKIKYKRERDRGKNGRYEKQNMKQS